MAIKINSIIAQTDREGVLCTPWLEQQNISRTEQGQYVHSGWLARIVPGIYRFATAQPTLFGALASIDMQVGLNYRIAASSALELHGFSHYISFGKQQTYIITPIKNRLPKWIHSLEWDMNLHENSTNVFDGILGVTTVEQNGRKLRASSPELAIMECLLFTSEKYSLMDVYHLMESLTTLRPQLVTKLLEQCTSVKVKRLFLYMAEKAGHAWFKRIDTSRVTLGSGPRSFIKGGVKIAKYNIMVPRELADYE